MKNCWKSTHPQAIQYVDLVYFFIKTDFAKFSKQFINITGSPMDHMQCIIHNYVSSSTFTFRHLADTFIQSDLPFRPYILMCVP